MFRFSHITTLSRVRTRDMEITNVTELIQEINSRINNIPALSGFSIAFQFRRKLPNVTGATLDLDHYRAVTSRGLTDVNHAFEPPLVRGSRAPTASPPPAPCISSAAYPTTHVIMIGEAGNYPA